MRRLRQARESIASHVRVIVPLFHGDGHLLFFAQALHLQLSRQQTDIQRRRQWRQRQGGRGCSLQEIWANPGVAPRIQRREKISREKGRRRRRLLPVFVIR